MRVLNVIATALTGQGRLGLQVRLRIVQVLLEKGPLLSCTEERFYFERCLPRLFAAGVSVF